LAQAIAAIGHHASSSCAAPNDIVTATHGTTAKLATTAYGVNCRNTAAVSGQTPSCVAIDSTIASRMRSGMAMRSSIQRSSHPAHAKIAPTHENDRAKDALATLCGRATVTTIAATASAFQEKVARPHARAASAAVAIVAARSAGSCAPLHHTKIQTSTIATAHDIQRGSAR
jgi:hypothetical protein